MAGSPTPALIGSTPHSDLSRSTCCQIGTCSTRIAVPTGPGLPQDGIRNRELSRPRLALRFTRLLVLARSLPGSPSLPARAYGLRMAYAVESSACPAWPYASLDFLPTARSLLSSPSLPAWACAATMPTRTGRAQSGPYPVPSPSPSMVSNRHDVRLIPPK